MFCAYSKYSLDGEKLNERNERSRTHLAAEWEKRCWYIIRFMCGSAAVRMKCHRVSYNLNSIPLFIGTLQEKRAFALACAGEREFKPGGIDFVSFEAPKTLMESVIFLTYFACLFAFIAVVYRCMGWAGSRKRFKNWLLQNVAASCVFLSTFVCAVPVPSVWERECMSVYMCVCSGGGFSAGSTKMLMLVFHCWCSGPFTDSLPK